MTAKRQKPKPGFLRRFWGFFKYIAAIAGNVTLLVFSNEISKLRSASLISWQRILIYAGLIIIWLGLGYFILEGVRRVIEVRLGRALQYRRLRSAVIILSAVLLWILPCLLSFRYTRPSEPLEGKILMTAPRVELTASTLQTELSPCEVSERYTLVQRGNVTSVIPIGTSMGPIEFYNAAGSHSNTGFESANTATFFLLRSAYDQQVYLFLLLGQAAGFSGSTSILLTGIPKWADLIVRDDSNDCWQEFDSDTEDTWAASIVWSWDVGGSDGVVIGELGASFKLTVCPSFSFGVLSAVFLSGPPDSPEVIPLDLSSDPIYVIGASHVGPFAGFTIKPTNPLAGEIAAFEAISLPACSPTTSYKWDFDGDTLFDVSSDSPSISHTFMESGRMAVTLRVRDASGATAEVTREIDVVDGTD